MRWVKWGLVAGWVGVHAALWNDLPPLPRFVLQAGGYSSLIGFTADSRSLVTRNATHLRVWDAADGRLHTEWPESDPKTSLRYLTPHSRTLVAEDTTKDTLVLFDLQMGERTELPAVGREMYGKDADKLFWLRDCRGISPDGRTFAYAAGLPATDAFVVRLWDIAGRTASDIGLERRGFSPAFAPDGKTLAIWIDGRDQAPAYTLLLDATTRQELGRIVTPPGHLIRLSFSPNGQSLAVFGYDPPPFPPRPPVPIPPGGPHVKHSWFQLLDVPSRKLIVSARNAGRVDWTADGHLLAAEETGLNAYDDTTGAEATGWDAPSLEGWRHFAGTFADGRIAIIVSTHSHPSWRNWLIRKNILPYKYSEDYQHAVRLYDAHTGRERSTIWTKGSSDYNLSPDGTMLAVLEFDNPFDHEGQIFLWDIPPRKPGGIVLGLMIGEVALAILWTAWRQRRARIVRLGVGTASPIIP